MTFSTFLKQLEKLDNAGNPNSCLVLREASGDYLKYWPWACVLSLFAEANRDGAFSDARFGELSNRIGSNRLEDILAYLSQRAGDDLMAERPGQRAIPRLIQALRKIDGTRRGRRYTDRDITGYKRAIAIAIQNAPHKTNKALAAQLGLARSTFKALELNAYAKKLQEQYCSDPTRFQQPHTLSGRVQAERARRERDDDE